MTSHLMDPGTVHATSSAQATGNSFTAGTAFTTSTAHDTDAAFDVTLRDGTVERVAGANAYEPERSMTTFFRTDGRPTVDCWSVRMASFRTDEILAIRRLEGVAAGAIRNGEPEPTIYGDAVLRVV
ncbi:MAG TPA: hypothetical protein PLS63_10360 [Microthrixaceae bacterium]|jgi:hypothetical protein|nr:hypothetical protein [Microthrixaceae bacterium]